MKKKWLKFNRVPLLSWKQLALSSFQKLLHHLQGCQETVQRERYQSSRANTQNLLLTYRILIPLEACLRWTTNSGFNLRFSSFQNGDLLRKSSSNSRLLLTCFLSLKWFTFSSQFTFCRPSTTKILTCSTILSQFSQTIILRLLSSTINLPNKTNGKVLLASQNLIVPIWSQKKARSSSQKSKAGKSKKGSQGSSSSFPLKTNMDLLSETLTAQIFSFIMMIFTKLNLKTTSFSRSKNKIFRLRFLIVFLSMRIDKERLRKRLSISNY